MHPSNFRIEGFAAGVPVSELTSLGVPVVADIGSGLLTPHPLLPDEPDATTTLAAGASVVTASGDKLLGGPQAGLIFGEATLVERLRRHPAARALRVDKLRLIQVLAEELAGDEGADIKANQSYAVWSPHSAFSAADVMLQTLANEGRP